MKKRGNNKVKCCSWYDLAHTAITMATVNDHDIFAVFISSTYTNSLHVPWPIFDALTSNDYIQLMQILVNSQPCMRKSSYFSMQ